VTEWKTRIGFLPRDLADEAKHVVIDGIADTSVQYQVMRLLERAFGAGYEAGFQRCHTEESWRQFQADKAAKQKAEEQAP
jgi:hypothetical protein